MRPLTLPGALAAITLTTLTGAPLAAQCPGVLNVCYYDLCEGAGDPEQVAPITLAGYNAIDIAVPDAASLAGCHILFAQNENNDGYGDEWTANLAAIEARVAEGMVLVFHDRAIGEDTGGGGPGAGSAGGGVEGEGGECVPFTFGDAVDQIPGLAAATCVRNFDDDVNVDVVTGGTTVTNGPFGTVDDTSLDGGNSSSHGYCEQSSLPGGAVSFLSRTVDTESVAFSYTLGAGAVYYSTMPLDFYLDGAGNDPPATAFTTIYAPNVLTYASEVASCGAFADWVDVPALSPLGLAGLASLLALVAGIALRRRARHAG